MPNILTFVPPVTDWIRDNADTGRFCSKMTDSQREGKERLVYTLCCGCPHLGKENISV